MNLVGKCQQCSRPVTFALLSQHIPVPAFTVVLNLVLDHVDHDLIANQSTLVHDLLGLLAEVGLCGDLGAKHVTGGLDVCVRHDHRIHQDAAIRTKWQTQYLSLIFGAWVPLPKVVS